MRKPGTPVASHLAATIFGGLIRVGIGVAVVVVRLGGGQGLKQRGEERFGLHPVGRVGQGLIQKLLKLVHRVARSAVLRLAAACAILGEGGATTAKHAEVKTLDLYRSGLGLR
jgi:hypothetical protein